MMNNKGLIGVLILIGIVVIVGGILLSGVLNKKNGGADTGPSGQGIGGGSTGGTPGGGGDGTGNGGGHAPGSGEQVFLDCATGAENMPRVLYSWKWSDIQTRMCDAVEGTSETKTFLQGDIIPALPGKNSLTGQTVSVRVDSVGATGPDASDYTADVTLLDEQGNEKTSKTVAAGENIGNALTVDGLEAIGKILTVDSIGVDAQTGVGSIQVKIWTGGVENSFFCDATQFSISFLKKLNGYYEGDLPLEQVTNQEVYLMKTAFSDDFVNDFDETNRIFGGFADTPVFYKDDETGLWKTFKSIQFEGAIPSPGKYRVTVENLPSVPLEAPTGENTAQECRQVGECRNWVDVETCTDGRTCTQGYCGATCNNCGGLAENAKRCFPQRGQVGAALQQCRWDDATQCLEWKNNAVCQNAVCDETDSGELWCIDITAGTCADADVLDKRCSGLVAEQCNAVYNYGENRWEKNWEQVRVCQNACTNGECDGEANPAGREENFTGPIFFQDSNSVAVIAIVSTTIEDVDRNSLAPVNDANVLFFDGNEFRATHTDRFGISEMPIQFEKGAEINVTVSKRGYQTYADTLTVPSDWGDFNFTVTLEPELSKKLVVGVNGLDDNSRIQGAAITFSGGGISVSGNTDSYGVKTWKKIPRLDYSITVSKEGYQDFEGTITASDENFQVFLEKSEEASSGSCNSCETIGERRCAPPITVKFELIEPIGKNNPFYYLPLEGFVGRGSGADTLQRAEYGVGFSVDAGDQIMAGPDYTYSPQNNGGGKFPTKFSFDDSLERIAGKDTRGTILEIKVKNNSPEREVIFSPSVATPVLMEIDTEKTKELKEQGTVLVFFYELRLPEGRAIGNAETSTKWDSLQGCSALPGSTGTFSYLDIKTPAGKTPGNIALFWRTFSNPLWKGKEGQTAKALEPSKSKIAAQGVFYSATGNDSPVLEFKKLNSGTGDLIEDGISEGLKFYAPDSPNNQVGTSVFLAGTPLLPLNHRQSSVAYLNDVLGLLLDGRACISTEKKDGYLTARIRWVEQKLVDDSLSAEAASLRNSCFTEQAQTDCSNIKDVFGRNISCENVTEGAKRCGTISNGEVTTGTVEQCTTDAQTGCLTWTFSEACTGASCSTAGGEAACTE